MLRAKGFYKDGKLEICGPLPEGIEQAEADIIIHQSGNDEEVSLKEQAKLITEQYYKIVHEPALGKLVPGISPVPYGGRVFDEQEMINLVDSSLDFWLTAGAYARKFESEFADKLGVHYCCLVNSGSSANLLAFMALTCPELDDRCIQKDDEVITVAAGFPTTVNPIVQFGAVPVFVDITLPTYNINVSMLEQARSDRTKAVMVAHTLGNPFDVNKVISFCQKHNLWLIEDNCDSLGSVYKERLTGTFGDIATSSFYPPHHITMGEGGAVYTNSSNLAKIINSLRDWGRDCVCPPGKDNTCGKRFELKIGQLPKGYDHKYVYSRFGYNLKVTDMQAAVGCAQLQKLDSFIETRRKNWQMLYDGLKEYEDIFILPRPTAGSEPSWFGFLLTIRENSNFTRNEIVKYLEANKIQTRMLFAGNYLRHPVFDYLRKEEKSFRVVGELVNTDLVMNNSFWFGVYPGLSEKMLNFIIEKIRVFVKVRI